MLLPTRTARRVKENDGRPQVVNAAAVTEDEKSQDEDDCPL